MLQVQAVSVYSIGNSHTGDSAILKKQGIYQLAQAMGKPFTHGWHIRCSRGLDYMWNNPNDVCVEPNAYGLFTDALTNYQWDVLMLQPFDVYTSDAIPENERELQAAIHFEEICADPPGRLFLYTTWASSGALDDDVYVPDEFTDLWTEPYAVSSEEVLRRQGFMNWYYAELKRYCDANEISLTVIPGGELIMELEQRIMKGLIPGMDAIDDVFRDYIHMDLAGRYLMAVAICSELYGVAPTDVPLVRYFTGGAGWGTPVTEAQAEELKKIVDAVMKREPFEPENIPVEFATSVEELDDLRQIKIDWSALSGYTYELKASTDLGSWDSIAGPVVGDGQNESVSVDLDSDRRFFRLSWY
ncbi:hypothetical protein DDZ13_10260 [Coraliomargarita sinensis]|uniref:Uncharacterized protein n=1 Tax=Coraliomargarita sinensis TaxID=2174842 RepID=A0A317ZIS6_9BACT|nr:hypothetical protein DDZ13_10260 [Coraliomargarita sinensis]